MLSNTRDSEEEEGQELEKEEEPRAAPWSKQALGSSSFCLEGQGFSPHSATPRSSSTVSLRAASVSSPELSSLWAGKDFPSFTQPQGMTLSYRKKGWGCNARKKGEGERELSRSQVLAQAGRWVRGSQEVCVLSCWECSGGTQLSAQGQDEDLPPHPLVLVRAVSKGPAAAGGGGERE